MMKTLFNFRTLCLLAGLSLFLPRSNGQAALLVLIFGDKAATENFHFTLDLGANVATLPGLSTGSAAIYPYFGLGTYIKLSDKWAFVPEFKPLSPRGADGVRALVDSVNNPLIANGDAKYKFSYIDIPMQFQRNLGKKFYVRAGPQFSYLTGASIEGSGGLNSGQQFTTNQDIKGDLNSIDLSFPIDVGFRIVKARGFKGIDIRARYCPGFLEVFADDVPENSTNSMFQFFLSFPFVNVAADAPKP